MVLWKEMNEGGKGGKERCAASEREKAEDELVRTCRVFKKTLETTRREYLLRLYPLISMLSYWFPNTLQELGQEW